MPGRRNFATERAAHDCASPVTQLAHYHLLTQHYPDHAVIGRARILAWLHDLGVRRLNAGRLTWRIVNRWRTHHGCPILRGMHAPSHKTPAITTAHALTAWLLSRFSSADLFQVVDMTRPLPTAGTFHATQSDAQAA